MARSSVIILLHLSAAYGAGLTLANLGNTVGVTRTGSWESFLGSMSYIRFSSYSRGEAENCSIGLFWADDGKPAAGRRFLGIALIAQNKMRATGVLLYNVNPRCIHGTFMKTTKFRNPTCIGR